MHGGTGRSRRRILSVIVALSTVASVGVTVVTGSGRAQAACDDITVTEAQGGSGLSAAINAANICDGFQTISIEPGTYSWSGSTITDTVTIAAADAANPPTLTGAGQGGYQFRANDVAAPITLEHLVVEGAFRAGLFAAVRSTVVLDGVGFVGSTTTCGITTAQAVRADGGSMTIRSSAIGASGCNGVQGLNEPRITLDDVEIAAMARYGVITDGLLIVANARIHDNGSSGVRVSGTDGATISGSAIYRNGDDGVASTAPPLTIRNSVIGLEPDGAGSLLPAGNADLGVDGFFSDVTLDNVVVAHNRLGLYLTNAPNGSTISGSEIRDHANVGMYLASASATMDTTDLRDNSRDCSFSNGTLVDGGGNTDSDGSCGVVQPNSPPTADVDRYFTDEDTTLNAPAPGVLDGDVDPDGDEISAELVTGPSNAQSFELFADGSFDYVPALDYFGVDTFEYRAADASSVSPTTLVEVTVRPVNDPPTIVVPAPLTVDIDTVVPLAIIVTDIDADDPPGEEDAVVPSAVVTVDAGALLFDTATHPNVAASWGPGGESPLFLSAEIGPLAAAFANGVSWQPAPGFVGIANVDASIRDNGENGAGGPLLAADSFQVTVADLNEPPVAVSDGYDTREDTDLTVGAPGVLINDSDPDGDPLTATVVDEPMLGTLTLSADGAFNYSPDPDANGVDTFTYVVSDGSAQSDPATATIDIEPVSEPWTLDLPTEIITDEDVPVVFTANLTDEDTLVTDIAAGTALGTVDVSGPAPDGTVAFTFTPDPDVSGSDTISIGVTDIGGTSLEFVPVTVVPVNDPPEVTSPAAVTTDEDVAVSFDVTVSDVETDPDALAFSATVPLAAGAVSWAGPDPAGLVRVTFAPTVNANGDPLTDVTIIVGDGGDTTATTVPITVVAVNDPPVGAPDAYTTDEDVALVVPAPGVLGNDTDVDSAFTAAAIETSPVNGTLVLAADGGFVYTPDPDSAGEESFAYRVTDGIEISDPVTVTIDVLSVNDAPTIVGPAQLVTDEDVPVRFVVSVGDVETAAIGLDVTADVATAVGAVAVAPIAVDGAIEVTFTPVADLNGISLGPITITVGDGIDNTELTVPVTIRPVDDPPVAVPDSYDTPEDTELVIDAPGLLSNDTDVDGDLISARLVDPPTEGAVTVQPDGSFVYTPALDTVGDVTFTYVAENASGVSDPVAATVTVEAVDDAPTITGPSTITFDEDTLGTTDVTVADIDTALDDLSVDADLPAGVGAVELTGPDATGAVTVTITPVADLNGDPVGDMVMTVSDATSSETLVVSVTIAPVDDSPVGVADLYGTDEDVALVVAAPGVLGNDLDPDSDGLTASIDTNPANGTIALGADGGFIYAPATDFAGEDSFTYVASDGIAGTAPVPVAVEVFPVNDPPVGAADAYATEEDTELVVAAPGVLGNDTDVDSAFLAAVLEAPPSNGSLVLAADGGFTYSPDPDFVGTDSFAYVASDGIDSSGSVTVTIDVVAVNDLPVAELTVTPDVVEVADVVTADGSASSDLEGDVATYRFDWGDGTVVESAAATVDHAYDEPGEYTVTLVVVDADGGESDPVAVTVVVGDGLLRVNTENDGPDLDPADGICWTGGFIATGEPACSFRAAVQEANGRGEDSTIAVPAGSYGAGGPPFLPVDVRVTIEGGGVDETTIGPGWNLIQQAGGELRDLTFEGMQLGFIDGRFDVERIAGRDDDGSQSARIFVGSLAEVAMSDATVESAANSSISVTGSLSASNLSITADAQALVVNGGQVELTDSTISVESAVHVTVDDGGSLVAKRLNIPKLGFGLHGIRVEDGNLELIESFIGASTGIRLVEPTSVATLDRSTVDGYVSADDGSITVTSSTIDGHVFASQAVLGIIRWSTVSRGLRLSQGEVIGTVVADSGSDTDDNCSLSPTVVTKSNADSSGSCGGIASSNLRLGPLADNGGPTLTRLPMPGSDLVDAGDDTCPDFDQRGVVRPIDGSNSGVASCDIGAVEAPEGSGTVPIAALTADPDRARPNETVTLDASESFDPDGEIVRYEFDFDDGTSVSGTDAVVTHSYDATGVYFPTVTVVDDDQQVSEPEFDVVVVQTAPITADLDLTPTVVAVGGTVTADASGSPSPDSTIVSYEIDWGDGTVATGAQPTATHEYAAAGEYVVTVTVTDELGTESDPATADVLVYDDALIVNTTVDEPDLDAADGICFTGEFIANGDPACSLRAAVEEANARGIAAVIVLGDGNHRVADSSVIADVEVTIAGTGTDESFLVRGNSAVLEPLVLAAGGSMSSLAYEGNFEVADGTTVDLVDVALSYGAGRVFVPAGAVLNARELSDSEQDQDRGIYVTGGTATIDHSELGRLWASAGQAVATGIDVGALTVTGGSAAVHDSSAGVANVIGGELVLNGVSVEGEVSINSGSTTEASLDTTASTLGAVRGGDAVDEIRLTSSTVLGNVLGVESELVVDSSTILGRVTAGGSTRIERSAIGSVTASCTFPDGATPVLVDNVDVDGSCGGGAVGDLLLGPLADNGGPTLTYLPLPGSPLVDAAGAGCPSTDQRGAFRPIDGNDDTTAACDAGAVEAPPGSGGAMPPATIAFDITFAGAPVDDEPFEVDVELVAPTGSTVVERVPLTVDPGWPETSSGCSGGLLDSSGERPTCSGVFTIDADSVVEVDVLASNQGDSPYPTFTGDCTGGQMTVGRGVNLTCGITFVRPDIGGSDPAHSAILRLDKRWIAPTATELPDATIDVDVLFGGFSTDIPVGSLRGGPLSTGPCTLPTDCEYYIAFRPAPLDLGPTIPDLVVVDEQLPDGWKRFFDGDCDDDGDIDDPQPGELLTCTITNVEAATPSPVLVEWHIDPVGSVLPLVEVEADLRLLPDDGGDDLFASVGQALPPAGQPDVNCRWIDPGVGDYPLVCHTVLNSLPGEYDVQITTPADDVWKRRLDEDCADGRVTAEFGAIAVCRVVLGKQLPDDYVDFSASSPLSIVTEGDDGRDAGELEVVVTFERPLTDDVELAWEIVPASAADAPDGWPIGDLDGDDLKVTSGVLAATAGSTEATITVTVAADRVVEPDDGFAFRITEPTLGGLATVFGAIRNDDVAPTLESVTATPDEGIFPLTITGEAIGGAPTSAITGYRWWLRAPSGALESVETVGPAVELELTEVGTFELRAAALDDAGNSSHTFAVAPRTTIEVEDRVPVIEVDDLIVDEGGGYVFLNLLDQVDVITAPGGDWFVRFASLPTADPGPGGAAPATPGEVTPLCGLFYGIDFEVGPNSSFRLDRDGRFSRGPSDNPTYWDEFRLLRRCDDPTIEGLEYRRLGIIGWRVGSADPYQVIAEFNVFIVDDDDGDVRPIIDTPELVSVSVPIGTTPPVKVAWTATASDPEDGELDVTCDPASGSGFGFGTTTVSCTAIDSAFHVVEDSFDVIVAEADDATVGDLAGAPVSRVPVGTAVRVRSGGYADGSDARIELRSDPVVLAEFVTDDGSVDAVVTIPAGTPPGEHTIVVAGVAPDGRARQAVFPIVVEELTCTITGTSGRDMLIGTRWNDVICGLGGDDLILGGRGDDVILGGAGDDIVLGGRGNDEIIGDDGHDFLAGDRGNDSISGGAGGDVLFGGRGDDALAGGDGDDLLVGGRGDDTLLGGPGDNRLR